MAEQNPGAAGADTSCTSGALSGQEKEAFRLGCNMLRLAGKLDFRDLPRPRASESLVDFLVRAGVAKTPQAALEGLLVAGQLVKVRADLLKLTPPH